MAQILRYIAGSTLNSFSKQLTLLFGLGCPQSDKGGSQMKRAANMKCFARSLRAGVAAVAISLVIASPAKADFIITGGTATVAQGGSGTVDFLITATHGSSLGAFNLTLQINVISGNAISDLTFSQASAQPAVYNQSNYVFAGSGPFVSPGNSFDGNLGAASIWGIPNNANNSGQNPRIYGSDSTYDGTSATITSANNLLVSVGFTANLGTPLTSEFSISLVGGVDNTAFYANNSGPTPTGLVHYRSTAADITVTPAIANTPAPSSLALAGIGSLSGLLYYWRSRKQARAHLSAA